MDDVITLSSDEEEVVQPPKKKVKLITLSIDKPVEKDETSTCIILSDDDDITSDEILLDKKPTQQCSASPDVEQIQEAVISDSVEQIHIEEKASDPLNVEAAEEPKPSPDNDDNHNSVVDIASNSNGIPKINGKHSDVKKKLFDFLDECINSLKKPAHQEQLRVKMPAITKYFEKLSNLNCDFKDLMEIINESKTKLETFPTKAIIYFCEVYRWLKSGCVSAENEATSTDKQRKIIHKLQKVLQKIQRRIKELDEAEVDFDDEENSHYLQASRYKERAAQIHTKLCKYQRVDPNYGRILYLRLDFSYSKYTEINQALNKKYRNNLVFPTYYEVDECIRKCVEQKNLNISEGELKSEIKRCFEELGNLLQKRRKLELHDAHNDYLPKGAVDPANQDPEIDQKLRNNFIEAKKKTEALVEKYVVLQDQGVNPNISSESDDSDVVESDCENEEKKENV